MMRNPGKVFLMLCLLTVSGGVVANAQVGGEGRIQANVPFAFSVGNTTLPAGKYEIRRIDDTSPNVLELRDAKGRTAVMFETENAQMPADRGASKTEVVFDKVGNQYFLSQIWVAGEASGNELPKSRMERRLMDGGGQSERHTIVGFLKHLKR